MKEIERVETSGELDVSTGWLTEITTNYYTDGTSEVVDIRYVNTHAPGWETNANN